MNFKKQHLTTLERTLGNARDFLPATKTLKNVNT